MQTKDAQTMLSILFLVMTVMTTTMMRMWVWQLTPSELKNDLCRFFSVDFEGLDEQAELELGGILTKVPHGPQHPRHLGKRGSLTRRLVLLPVLMQLMLVSPPLKHLLQLLVQLPLLLLLLAAVTSTQGA